MEGIFKELSLQPVYWLGRFKPVLNVVQPWRGIGAIFMYHRVLPEEQINNVDDPSVVSTGRFEEQIKYIAENHTVIGMDDLPSHLEKPQGFAVAVTFDDGYKDNKIHALPILEKYQVPATIYVATRFPDNGKGMWWLELEELLCCQDNIHFKNQGQDTIWDISTPAKRQTALRRFIPIFLAAGLEEQETILDSMRQGRPAAEFADVMMTWKEIREISDNPLISIGSHTHNHLDVARLAEDQFRQEIETSKTILEDNIGREIRHFAFPYGSPKKPTEREFRLLQPFMTAATTRSLLLTAKANPRNLPRLQITQNDDVDRLKIRLSGIEDLVRIFYYKLRKV